LSSYILVIHMISVSALSPISAGQKRALIKLGAKISPGDVSIIDLTNSAAAMERFLAVLEDNQEREIDPIIQPTFGIFGAVTPQVQAEVCNIISSYERADFALGNPPPIALAGVLPPAFMWQYHHVQMAIVAVVRRLGDPGVGPFTNTLDGLSAASFICDLSIIYANAVFVLRIMRIV
jgi:hypothetical protein